MTLAAYNTLLARKVVSAPRAGLDQIPELHPDLKPHQRHVTEFALAAGRRFLGFELKPEYFRLAGRHLAEAEASAAAGTLLDRLDAVAAE